MKFVLLKKKRKKNPYDTIIKHGCGPNFVLNREKMFRNMIKEQGAIFWFRFWFTVFYNPACEYFQMIQEHFPEMLNNAHKYIHQRFLQASPDSVSEYCIRIIKSLKDLPPENKIPIHSGLEEHVIDLARLQDLILRATHIAFGVSLCVMFYNWLEFEDTPSSARNYWSLPSEYEEKNFKPGLLEQFLANIWKEQLPILFGVSMNDIPWLRELLQPTEKIQLRQDPVDDFELTRFIEQITEELRYLQNEKLKAIVASDEDVEILRRQFRQIKQKQILAKEKISKTQPEVKHSENKTKKERLRCSKYLEDKLDRRKPPINKNSGSERAVYQSEKCAWCLSGQSSQDKFVPCLQCLEDKWTQPRFYCSFRCQTKHWYDSHFKEHTEYKEGKMYNRIEHEMLGNLRCTIRHYIFACAIGLCAISLFPSIIRYCIMILHVIADL